MKNLKIPFALVAAVAGLSMSATAAFAMPADIEEAVTSEGYDSTQHQNGTATYDDSELIPIDETYVSTANVNVRTSPFGTIIAGTVPGQEVHVIGECPDCMWYKVDGSVQGYVYASYFVPKSEYNAATGGNSDTGHNIRELDMYMVVDTYALNMRTAPSMDAQVIKSLPEGTEVHVTGKVLNSEWYRCDVDGQTVYMSDNYLTPELPQNMVCATEALNIRSGAGMDCEVIGTLHRGEKVKVTAEENDWLKFSFSDGRVGYVYDQYMAVVS